MSVSSLFDIKNLETIVTKYATVAQIQSESISVADVVEAYYAAEKEKGMVTFFKQCIERLGQESEQIKLLQLSLGAVFAYKKLPLTLKDYETATRLLELTRTSISSCELVYQKIMCCKTTQDLSGTLLQETTTPQAFLDIAEAEAWIGAQSLSLKDIAEACTNNKTLNKLAERLAAQTKQYAKRYEEKNHFSKNDGGKIYRDKTLHGCPYDHNRLGKIGEKVIVTTGGSLIREDVFHPGFEGFYIAGSQICLANGTYNLMQAPMLAHKDKVDTVEDFWNTVIVLCKSPVIVTTHNPEEKIPTKGYAERATYWMPVRFTQPLTLKEGWVLTRNGDDVVIATSRHADSIRLVKRLFVATKADTGERHTVTQFHYQGWPDHLGAPDHELIVIAHKAVEEEYKQRGLSRCAPLTTHCAAGMGRSATFLAIDSLCCELFSKLEKKSNLDAIKLNIAQVVYSIKKQRPGTLGSECHWMSIFYALRRVYCELTGVPNQEIRALENALEQQTISDGNIVKAQGSKKYKKIKAQRNSSY